VPFWSRSRRSWRRCWRSKRPRTRPPRARHYCNIGIYHNV
jgi:hypothetical protein